jgi:hypothetical protein
LGATGSAAANEILHFMESESSSPCSQKPSTLLPPHEYSTQQARRKKLTWRERERTWKPVELRNRKSKY